MTDQAPICPVHQVPMRPGKYPGSFYCARKVGSEWCIERISPAKRPQMTAQRPSSPAPSQTPSQTQDTLVTEALRFAASVFHGTGDEEKSLACFQRALEIARKG